MKYLATKRQGSLIAPMVRENRAVYGCVRQAATSCLKAEDCSSELPGDLGLRLEKYGVLNGSRIWG